MLIHADQGAHLWFKTRNIRLTSLLFKNIFEENYIFVIISVSFRMLTLCAICTFVSRSQSCWMMKGARQNVKSCPRMERRLLPLPTRHNTHSLMTALQPGRTQQQKQASVFLIVKTEGLKEGFNICSDVCEVLLETHLSTCKSPVNLLARKKIRGLQSRCLLSSKCGQKSHVSDGDVWWV